MKLLNGEVSRSKDLHFFIKEFLMDQSEKIIQCVLQYVDGWYEADDSKMNEALSKYLVKRRVVSENEIWDVTKEWMIQATREGKGKIDISKSSIKEITILDNTDKIATVKLVSNDFIDYLHLVNLNNKWSIVNALWEYKE